MSGLTDWIGVFRGIGASIKDKIGSLAGTEKARSSVGRNEFGDTTVYIDAVADELTKTVVFSELGYSILTEESGILHGDREFPIVIVDPIDGSLNAKRGIPYYSFSIAVADGPSTNDIFAGYVIDLSCGKEFWAQKGRGAFVDGVSIVNKNRELKVAAVEGLKEETDVGLLKAIFSSFYRVRAMGSVALDMCYLAAGAFDIFVHVQPSRVIDYAAGKVILEEAGGIMSFADGRKFECSISMEKFEPFWCVGNSTLMDKALRVVERFL